MYEAIYIEQGEHFPLWRCVAVGTKAEVQKALTEFVATQKDDDLTHYRVREVEECVVKAAPPAKAFLI